MAIFLEFDQRLHELLPETAELLRMAHLRVHPRVSRITLHDSRGLAEGYRSDSDIDLSLIVDHSGAALNLKPGAGKRTYPTESTSTLDQVINSSLDQAQIPPGC